MSALSPVTAVSSDNVLAVNTFGIEHRVALVCMPWGSVQKPSLAMAILKRCVQMAGFKPELHFLNVRFAELVGWRQYERFSDANFGPEWFFSQALFGPSGGGEMRNAWSDLRSNPAAEELLEEMRDVCHSSDELCAKVADEYVPRFIDECVSQVDWGRYMAVGFTTTFGQSLASLLLAKRIKEAFPHVSTVFGGANVDSEMGVEFVKGFPWVDYVVHGEAENSFPALLRNLASGQKEERVPGVSMRRGDEVLAGDNDAIPIVNMNESPVPDYSDYVRELDRSGLRKKFGLRLFFESSRGCWWGAKHHCTFCGLNATTMTFRKKDPERVYDEILELSRTYRCLTFAAADNILATEYFTKLLPRLADLNVDFQFFYEVKANLSREQLRLLAAAGIRELQPGIESLNTRILQLMRKGVTAIQNIQLMKWCFEYDIDVLWNVLYGFPGETSQDYEGFPHLFRLLSHLQPPVGMVSVMFERFSPYFFDKEKFGLTLQPSMKYSFIFPQSRVRLEKVAYFFDGRWEGQTADPDDYIGPTREAWEQWKKQWQDQNIYCYYRKGPDHVAIYDRRPRNADDPIAYRQIHLNEKMGAIYVFCDENHSLRAICEMATKQFGAEAKEEQVRSWLDWLVSQNLMFEEAGRYLSLAVRKKPSRRGGTIEVS